MRTNELRIEGGRHLLTQLLADPVIPNDTLMHPHRDRIQVRCAVSSAGGGSRQPVRGRRGLQPWQRW